MADRKAAVFFGIVVVAAAGGVALLVAKNKGSEGPGFLNTEPPPVPAKAGDAGEKPTRPGKERPPPLPPIETTREGCLEYLRLRAGPVRAGDEVQGAVELGDVVEEHVQVERERLGHPVLAVVRREVVVPLPGLALEGGLHVHLDLLHVQLVGAEELGRGCLAMEISPAYVDVAVRRFEKATGKKAVLDGTEKTFEQVSGERKKETQCSSSG